MQCDQPAEPFLLSEMSYLDEFSSTNGMHVHGIQN